ncbi:hypothetical protein TCSYLVIO_010740, partial [Trypanosoma cruzi]
MQNKLISGVEISIGSPFISRCFDTIPAQMPAPSFSPHCASATANTSSPTSTRPGTRSEVILLPPSLNSLQLANDIGFVPLNGSTAAPACSTAAAPLPQHINTTSRSITAEVNTRRDMLGLCRSLSPPSLILPLDPVTRRRLCVRGAMTAATRESIQICVCAVCVLFLVLSEPSNFTVAIRVWLLSFLACLCSRSGEGSNSGNTSDTLLGSRAEHPRKVQDTRQSGRNSMENNCTQKRAAPQQHGGSQHTRTERERDMHAEFHHSATPFKVLPKQSASDTVIGHTLPVD